MALDDSKFNAGVFTDGAKPKPVILLLDISGSMDGENISTLNSAVETMISSFKKVAAEQVVIQLAVITFASSASKYIPLQPVENVTWQELNALGGTNLADALREAKKMVEDRSIIPSRAYRPVVILVSDGYPDKGWEQPMDDFISNGRSQKCDRMAMLIGDNSAATVMEQFLRGSGNRVFFANDARDIPTFFRYATMSTVTSVTSSDPNVTVTLTVPLQNTLEATVMDTTCTEVQNFQKTVVVTGEEQDDES